MSEIRVRYDAGRTKPFYEMQQEDENRVLELLRTAKKINLGNMHFEYYATSKSKNINFYLVEHAGFWQLVVKYDDRTTDVYKIGDDEAIKYQYSDQVFYSLYTE